MLKKRITRSISWSLLWKWWDYFW